MVFVDSNENFNFRQMIQDWLTQSWLHKEPNPAYREALTAVLQVLWSGANTAQGSSRISFLPLPSLCARALGKVNETTTAVNAAWVLLYTASNLLDKVEDEETEHPIFAHLSPSVVLNLTTGLILHSERILAELEPQSGTTRAEVIDALRRKFNQAALEVCAGQHLDLTVREPGFHEIWEIVDGKSGKFFSLGAYLGARLAAEDAAVVEAFSEMGRRLGILIQIRNDLQDFGGDQDTGSDLASEKRTLPVLYALQVLPAEERAQLATLLTAAQIDPAAEIAARKMIKSAGAIVYLCLEAEKHYLQARKTLDLLGLEPQAVQPLIDLLDFANPTKKLLNRR